MFSRVLPEPESRTTMRNGFPILCLALPSGSHNAIPAIVGAGQMRLILAAVADARRFFDIFSASAFAEL